MGVFYYIYFKNNKMPTSSYRTRTNNKSNSIFLRYRQGNQFDTEASTGIQVPKGKWSSSLQRINPTDEIDYEKLNAKLRDLKVFIERQYSKDSTEGVIFNNKWLKQHLNSFLKRKTIDSGVNEKHFFSAFLDYFISNAKKRLDNPNNPIKYRTIQHYQTTKNKIEAYEKYSGKNLTLEDLTLKFHSDFIEFLENIQKLNYNTIGGYVDVIKQACNKAELKGYNVCKDFKSSDFYTPSNNTYDTYLSLPEIHNIYNHTFDKDYLDNARDWLIISTWTGLRVSDLLTLNKSNIEDGFIKKDTLKTKFPVIIPIHKNVKAILSKRNGKFPRKISDIKYNKYIKEVCQDVGLTQIIEGSKMCAFEIIQDGKKKKIHRKKFGKYQKYELISSHCGRRSFATNHYGKLDTLTLMKITGHKTEAMFLSYIKITPSEYAIKLKEYWKKIDTKEFVNS